MNEKQITLSDGKVITIKRLPLGKFGQLILTLEGALKIFSDGNYPDVGKLKNNDFLALIPRLLNDAWPEMIGIMSIVSGLSKEYLSDIGIDDASEILLAFFETNNVPKLFANIKKIMALSKPVSPQPDQSAASTSTDGSSSEPTSSPANTDGAGPKS